MWGDTLEDAEDVEVEFTGTADALLRVPEPSACARVILLYLFFAANPVRPGKYVFTIFVHTFPCSLTARIRVASASEDQCDLSMLGLSVSVHRLAHWSLFLV